MAHKPKPKKFPGNSPAMRLMRESQANAPKARLKTSQAKKPGNS